MPKKPPSTILKDPGKKPPKKGNPGKKPPKKGTVVMSEDPTTRQLDFGWWQIFRSIRSSSTSDDWARDQNLTSAAYGAGFAGVLIAEDLNALTGAPSTRPESKIGAVEHWVYTIDGLPENKKLYRYELEYKTSDKPWSDIKAALGTIRNAENVLPGFLTVFSQCSPVKAVPAEWLGGR